jgi:uncharacterized protein YodC (DUF2158 family)
MKKLTVIPLGTKVGLYKDEDVVGTVRSMTLHANNSVSYEVGWWSGRSFITDHFYESELNPEVVDRQQIGFSR